MKIVAKRIQSPLNLAVAAGFLTSGLVVALVGANGNGVSPREQVSIGSAASPRQESLESFVSRSLASETLDLSGVEMEASEKLDPSSGDFKKGPNPFVPQGSTSQDASKTNSAREEGSASSSLSAFQNTVEEFDSESSFSGRPVSYSLRQADTSTLEATDSSDQQFQLAAMGPITSVALLGDGSMALEVLGQQFVTPASEVAVAVGDYVYAASVDGETLDVLSPIGEEYLLGVSDVFVAGPVAAVEGEIAHFSVGSTSFDYTNLLSDDPEFSLAAGEFVEIIGNETVLGGAILLGIHGSGISRVRGIHGSGISRVRGIHGSGISRVRGIHGSGISRVRGIHGSGISRR
jgi:hypothetical protein